MIRAAFPASVLLLTPVLLLGACSGSNSDSSAAPGGVSAGEARALDEAAQMIDDQRLPAGAVPSAQPPAASPEPAPSPANQPAAKPAR